MRRAPADSPGWLPASGEEHPEQDLGEERAPELGFALFGHHEVGGAHEAEQQPDDQQVGMHHPRDVERDVGEEQIANDVLQAQRDAEDDLARKEAQGRNEVQLGDSLRLVFKRWNIHV